MTISRRALLAGSVLSPLAVVMNERNEMSEPLPILYRHNPDCALSYSEICNFGGPPTLRMPKGTPIRYK